MRKIFMVFLIFTLCGAVFAQTQADNSAGSANGPVFPQWSLDLRRGEIVAFGSFPFTFFFTSFFMDTYRTIAHNGDSRYAPWPLKPAGAVDMTPNEQMMTIGIAAGSAVVIALVDYLIVSNNRKKKTQEILSQSPGTPIIIRRPMYAENGDNTEPADPSATMPSAIIPPVNDAGQ
ncbi:MAG: hypothetical protein FWD78_07155 [Treponema sp.]|nr:hypothetical protein [Treponema sp.]